MCGIPRILTTSLPVTIMRWRVVGRFPMSVRQDGAARTGHRQRYDYELIDISERNVSCRGFL